MKQVILLVIFFSGSQLIAQKPATQPAGHTKYTAASNAVQAFYNITPHKDMIYFLDGRIKEGRITALEKEIVQFVHQEETLKYEFKKDEIERIEFASGRTEMVNEPVKNNTPAIFIVTKNQVAVLPIGYIAEASDLKLEEMRFRLQEMTINFMNNSSSELRFRDPVTVNAMLSRSGINDENIRDHTAKELADILQVEYVIMGTVMQDKGNIITITSGNSTRSRHRHRHHDDNHSRHRNRVNQVTRTNQHIETEVSLSIYNGEGEMIYNKSRTSMLSDADAYRATLHYMLKRTPLYKR